MTACSDDNNKNDGQTESETIAGIASEIPELTVLVQALNRVGLVPTFNSEGDFTVFAPTNAAFQLL